MKASPTTAAAKASHAKPAVAVILEPAAVAVILEPAAAEETLIESLTAEHWNIRIPNHHYSLGQIAVALLLMLDCRASLRGTALTIGIISRLLGWSQEVPSPTTVRSWLLRIGLYQLERPLEKADDWVWIVDHTVQIGELKALLIVGLRLSAWQQQ